jgi:glycosyltransferase involved in cell wall biosynthesis
VVPAILRPVVRSTFRKMLRRESRVLANREVYWVSRSHASSLRSIDETERLRRRVPGAQVFSLPVAVPIPPQPAHRLSRRPMIAVFTGGLGYRPNLEALRAYVQQIIPAFGRRGISPPNLHVIGNAPDALRRGVEHPSVRFLGYVADLNSELLQAQVFFAPIVSGSGVKTKVLEALACGLPVIGLPLGLAGLRGQSGRDYLEARDPTEFVNQFVRLDEDSMLAQSIGAAARKLAVEHYSLDATTRILGEQVGALDFSNGTSDPSRREMADLAGGRFARLGSKRRDGPARVTPGD